MKKLQRFSLLFVFCVILSLCQAGTSAKAVAPPDVINKYTVNIFPQDDGSLRMEYLFDYCATTDFPSGADWFEAGVPNKNFEIVDYGDSPWVLGASKSTSGGSWVHLDFASVPKKGDCFKFHFTTLQRKMAYPLPNGEGVSFQFIPGWYDYAEIENLTINWHASNSSLIVNADPPIPITEAEDGTAILTWTAENLKPDEKFEITVIMSADAFPGLDTSVAPSVVPGENDASGSGLSTFLIVLIVIVAVFLIAGLIAWWVDDDSSSSGGGSYGGGSYIGSYPRSTTTRSSPRVSSPSSRPSTRSRTGGGSFGGRGSSCASAPSCACACACAGGGRAGCSRKGFQIRPGIKEEKERPT